MSFPRQYISVEKSTFVTKKRCLDPAVMSDRFNLNAFTSISLSVTIHFRLRGITYTQPRMHYNLSDEHFSEYKMCTSVC